MDKKLTCLVIVLCGVSALAYDTVDRIANGNDGNINQFPYSSEVSIQRISETNTTARGHKCGGALISLQHVLTAATCLFNLVNGTFIQLNTAEYRVFGGAALLTADNDQNRIRQIENVTLHPGFVRPPAGGWHDNLAIITLRTPFSNATVTPISVPAASFNPPDFTLCQIAGWGGQNITASASYRLRFATKFLYNTTLCNTLYTSGTTQTTLVTPAMVCAAPFNTMSSTCLGDEGSALVCNGALTGILFQTNACTATVYPEVYARVANYSAWITTVTGGSTTIRPELTLFAILAVVTAKLLHRA